MQPTDILRGSPVDEVGEWRFRLCAVMISALLVTATYNVFLHKPSDIVIRNHVAERHVETAGAQMATAGVAQN